jgi:ER protein Pkr1
MEPSGIIQVLVDLIFQPGSSLKLVPVINIAILALLVVLGCLAYARIALIHIVVLASLAIGLLLSVNWLVCYRSPLIACSTAHLGLRLGSAQPLSSIRSAQYC